MPTCFTARRLPDGDKLTETLALLPPLHVPPQIKTYSTIHFCSTRFFVSHAYATCYDNIPPAAAAGTAAPLGGVAGAGGASSRVFSAIMRWKPMPTPSMTASSTAQPMALFRAARKPPRTASEPPVKKPAITAGMSGGGAREVCSEGVQAADEEGSGYGLAL